MKGVYVSFIIGTILLFFTMIKYFTDKNDLSLWKRATFEIMAVYITKIYENQNTYINYETNAKYFNYIYNETFNEIGRAHV